MSQLPLAPLLPPLLHTLPSHAYPAPAWVWLLDPRHAPLDLDTAASQVFALTDWLSGADIAHNVFITR